MEIELVRAGHVYLVLDCSHSMSGDKLTQAKSGAVAFAEEAAEKGYHVGLVQFDSSAKHICEPQSDLGRLRSYVDEIAVGGTTNMADGIRMATEKLGPGPGARAMVVVTDGKPNDERAAIAAAADARRHGVEIITIGTDDADAGLLARLASRGDLSTMVASATLGAGIASTARMLPGGGLNATSGGR